MQVKMFRSSIFVSTVFLVLTWEAGCHRIPVHTPEARIAGGKEAKAHSAPFMAYMETDANTSCGATLISKKYLLTAAHCLSGTGEVDILLGAHNITDTESSQQVITVKKSAFKIHSEYNHSPHLADIALIELSKVVKLKKGYIELVKLPKISDIGKNYENSPAVAYGWGPREDTSKEDEDDSKYETSPVLRIVESTIMPLAMCKRYLKNTHDDNICMDGSGGKGACHGDSGGPLIVNQRQVGVVSFSPTCQDEYPTAFASIDFYIDWITKNSDVALEK